VKRKGDNQIPLFEGGRGTAGGGGKSSFSVSAKNPDVPLKKLLRSLQIGAWRERKLNSVEKRSSRLPRKPSRKSMLPRKKALASATRKKEDTRIKPAELAGVFVPFEGISIVLATPSS